MRSRRRNLLVAVAISLGSLALSTVSCSAPDGDPSEESRTRDDETSARSPSGDGPATEPGMAEALRGVVGDTAWEGCKDSDMRDLKAQCTTLTVPMDYDNPNGAKVRLAVSRVKHTAPKGQYEGIMLTNPGGPGVPGLAVPAVAAGGLPKSVFARYDWIGFDPRGIGASRPAVHCDPDNDLLYRRTYHTTTGAQVAGWKRQAKRYATACKEHSGKILDHMSTEEVALDMESIRRSLKAKQVSFYGVSYGTYLGAVYATQFPDRLHRFVLDSIVDPRDVWYQSVFSQDLAFERNADAWFRWLASHHKRYRLGATEDAVERKYYATLNQLPTNPRPGRLGQNEWTTTFLTALYSPDYWDTSASMWRSWLATHDPRGILSAPGVGGENTQAANLAVTCTDASWPGIDQLVNDTQKTYPKARFVTWANTWQSAPCAHWPAQAQQPVDVDGSRVGSALFIDETHDGPTPFKGSLELRRRTPQASLVSVPGGSGHGESLSGENSCVTRHVATYLQSGKLPKRVDGNKADATCPRIVPKPGE